jgi:nuclear pore complex protein Nup205
MLALSCLDMVIELDAQNSWTNILSARGYLKFIIDSLLETDRHLIALLNTQIKSLRPLYVYESKMVNISHLSCINN